MFATLRAEDRDGEVICISSTTQLPQSGQNQNHFACDRCRVKKVDSYKPSMEREHAFNISRLVEMHRT